MVGAGLVQDTGALRTSGVDFVTNQLNSLDHSVMTTGGGGDTGGNFKRGKKMATQVEGIVPINFGSSFEFYLGVRDPET